VLDPDDYLHESGPFVAEKLMLYSQVTMMKAQAADALEDTPGG